MSLRRLRTPGRRAAGTDRHLRAFAGHLRDRRNNPHQKPRTLTEHPSYSTELRRRSTTRRTRTSPDCLPASPLAWVHAFAKQGDALSASPLGNPGTGQEVHQSFSSCDKILALGFRHKPKPRFDCRASGLGVADRMQGHHTHPRNCCERYAVFLSSNRKRALACGWFS